MSAPAVIIDTNVWLDWLVFDDPSSRPLREAIDAGTLRACATPVMRGELQEVLSRPLLAARRLARDAMQAQTGGDPIVSEPIAAFDRAVVLHDPAPTAPLHCTDPDDQMFLDLAWQQRPAWLITRDRALLKLARRALRDRLHIVTPEAFARAMAAPTGPGEPTDPQRRRGLLQGATLLASAAAAGCSAVGSLGPKAPVLEYQSLSVSEVRLEQLRFTLRLSAVNPNGFDLSVRDFHFDLSLLGQPAATARGSGEALRLPAHGRAELPLELRVRTADLLTLLRKSADTDWAQVPWKVRGEARWSDLGFTVPFVREGRIDLLSRLRAVLPGR